MGQQYSAVLHEGDPDYGDCSSYFPLPCASCCLPWAARNESFSTWLRVRRDIRSKRTCKGEGGSCDTALR
jgi:hypothetical protein